MNESFNPFSFAPDQKLKILMHCLDSFREQLLHLEATANRMTLSVVTGLIVLPVSIRGVSIGKLIPTATDNVVNNVRYVASLILVFTTVFTIWLLIKNLKHVRWLRRSMVRIQQILGLYTNDIYTNSNQLKDKNLDLWFDEPTVLELPSQEWGKDGWKNVWKDGWLETQVPYMFAVFCSGILGTVILIK